jgi:hypothetical protein
MVSRNQGANNKKGKENWGGREEKKGKEEIKQKTGRLGVGIGDIVKFFYSFKNFHHEY